MPLYQAGNSLGDWSRNQTMQDQVQVQRENALIQQAIAQMQEQGLNNRFGQDAGIRRDEIGKKYDYMGRALGQNDRQFSQDVDLRRQGLANQLTINEMPYNKQTVAERESNEIKRAAAAEAALNATRQFDLTKLGLTTVSPYQDRFLSIQEKVAGMPRPEAIAANAEVFQSEALGQAQSANSEVFAGSSWTTSKSKVAQRLLANPDWVKNHRGIYWDSSSDAFMPDPGWGARRAYEMYGNRQGGATDPGTGKTTPTGISRQPATGVTNPATEPSSVGGFRGAGAGGSWEPSGASQGASLALESSVPSAFLTLSGGGHQQNFLPQQAWMPVQAEQEGPPAPMGLPALGGAFGGGIQSKPLMTPVRSFRDAIGRSRADWSGATALPKWLQDVAGLATSPVYQYVK